MDAKPVGSRTSRRARSLMAVAALVPAVIFGTAGCIGPLPPGVSSAASPGSIEPSDQPDLSASEADQVAEITRIVEEAMASLDLKAVIAEVQVGDRILTTQAFGESIHGRPRDDRHALPQRRRGVPVRRQPAAAVRRRRHRQSRRHHRPVGCPSCPIADTVTLLMLANQTAGYPDFETEPGVAGRVQRGSVPQFTYEERIDVRVRPAAAVRAGHELELLAHQLHDPRAHPRRRSAGSRSTCC